MMTTKKGFTLIELMIVVAIIGILAAIAIPNFLRFQAKSKQAEAKTNLGAIGTTAEAFRAEYDTYLTTLLQLGWKEQGNCRYVYYYGTGTGDDIHSCSVTALGAAPGVCAAAAPALVRPATTAGFTAGASGQVDKDTTCDDWIYNDLRQLSNPVNDVAT